MGPFWLPREARGVDGYRSASQESICVTTAGEDVVCVRGAGGRGREDGAEVSRFGMLAQSVPGGAYVANAPRPSRDEVRCVSANYFVSFDVFGHFQLLALSLVTYF